MATIHNATVYEIAKGGFRGAGTECVGTAARGAVDKVPDGLQIVLQQPKFTRGLNKNGKYMIAADVGGSYLCYEGKLEGWGNMIHAVFYHVKCVPNPTEFYKTAPSDEAQQSAIQMGGRRNRAANPRESYVSETAMDVLIADLTSDI
jgi:GTPase involved in cell partitioning and DNA repair